MKGDERVFFVAASVALMWAFTQQALRLQRAETDRRLHELNNEAARLQEAVSKNVSHDTWQAFAATYVKDGDRIGDALDRIRAFQNKLLGAVALSTFVMPVVVAVIIHYTKGTP